MRSVRRLRCFLSANPLDHARHRARHRGWPTAALRAGLGLLIVAGLLSNAQAQFPPQNKFGPQKSNARSKSGSSSKSGKAAPKSNDKKGGTSETPAVVSDPEKLPPGYVPPAEPHPSLLIEKPLLSPDELTRLEKELGVRLQRYRDALTPKGGVINDQTKEYLRKGIRYRLGLLTLKENRDDLAKLREDLSVRDLQLAGKILDKPKDVEEFRKFIMKEITEQAAQLLDNNFYVRLQAVILLGELELLPADSNRRLSLQAYTPAAIPLLQVVTDPEQPVEVKIPAVVGLYRILLLGTPDVQLRSRIAEAFVAELKTSNTHWAYQARLAHALTGIDKIYDLQQKPFVIQALAMVISDPQRDWRARAEAARSLGRVPMDGSINVKLLAHEIAKLGSDMAKAHEQSPQEHYWKMAFWNLYMAFQAYDEFDKDAERKRKGGLLNNPVTRQAAVREAYDKVLPLVRAVLKDQPIPPETQQDIAKWLEQNKPTDYKLTPTSEPISISREPQHVPTVSSNVPK